MPTKHIDDITWRKVEKETLKAVIATSHVFKETEILRALILKGMENMTDEDYRKLTKK